MGFGMAKDNKFEIVAIIREELLRKTKVELKFKDTSVVTQLEKVDFDYFVIANNSDIPLSFYPVFYLAQRQRHYPVQCPVQSVADR